LVSPPTRLCRYVSQLKPSTPFQNFSVGDVEKSNGKIIYPTSLLHAETICNGLGKRLPTAREVAVHATKYGAVIKEIDELTIAEARRRGFELKVVLNLDGSIDQFYFSRRNYKSDLPSDLDRWLFAASLHVLETNKAFVFYPSGNTSFFPRDDLRFMGSGVIRCFGGVN